MAQDDAFAQFETLLRESVDSSVRSLVLEEDDISWRLVDEMDAAPSAGRQTNLASGASALGDATNFEASWRVKYQDGGLVTGGAVGGGTGTAIGADNAYHIASAADSLFPDPTQAAQRSHIQIRMFLKRMQGVLAINRSQIAADLLTNPLEQIVGDQVEDATRLVRNLWAALFWSRGNGIIAEVNLGAGYNVGEGSNRKEVAVDAGTAYRFVRGQRYVGTAISSGTPTQPGRAGSLNAPGIMRCVDINDDGAPATVILESEPGEGTIALSDDDALIWEGVYDFNAAKSYAMNSVETLLLASGGGKFPGTNFDVDSHFRLRAFVTDDSTSRIEPSMEAVAKTIDKMMQAGHTPPEVLIAEPAVWSRWSHLERQSHGIVQIPMGATFQAAGGVQHPLMAHAGFTFQRASSNRVRENGIIGLSKGTFLRFMPVGKAVMFASDQGGVSGAPGIFSPIRVGTRLSGVAAAEFEFFGQIGCTNPRRNMRHLGLESTITAS